MTYTHLPCLDLQIFGPVSKDQGWATQSYKGHDPAGFSFLPGSHPLTSVCLPQKTQLGHGPVRPGCPSLTRTFASVHQGIIVCSTPTAQS